MIRKFPGMMPGKGRFIKRPQVPVIGNTDLDLLLSKLNKRVKPMEAKYPVIRKCNLCGRLFPRSELTFVYPALVCQDCCDMTDPSEGKSPWDA